MDLIIDTYGTRIGCTGERIVLSFPHTAEKKEYPIQRVEKIVILRPASLTTHAVKLALEHDVDIVYLGSFGKPIGRMFSSEPRGLANLRRAQLEVSSSGTSLALAKAFVKGKCGNQIAYLRYLGYRYKRDFASELLQAQTMFDTIDLLPLGERSKKQLFGIEGYIADRYFSGLKKLYRFSGRRPRGRDKFNSVLNYGYGILYNEVERMCLYVGLDPYLGLYHSERYGKPALVLDLVEEFRVPVVDGALFPLFVERKLGRRNYFERIGTGAYQLSAEGKYVVVGAVLKRLNQVVRWRGKHYPVKAVIEQQIRALARYFLAKEEAYLPFDTTVLLPHDE